VASGRDAVDVERFPGTGAGFFRLTGSITERFGPELLGPLPPVIVLDLGGVRSITSPGVRRWIQFLGGLPPGTQLYLLRCTAAFIDQINLVLNFAGPAVVVSAIASYFCGRCLLEHEVEVDVLRHGDLLRSGHVPAESCPKCRAPLTFEDPEYFRFVARVGAKGLDPAASRLLTSLGVRTGSHTLRRPLEVSKLVDERVTVLKLSGDLDERCRPSRITTGLEGAVLLEVGEVELKPNGQECWNRLFDALSAQCTQVALVSVPGPIAELIEQGSLEIGKACLHSVKVPCYCAECDELSTITVALAGRTPGDKVSLRCARRGHRVEMVAGTVNLDGLIRQAKPLPPALAELVPRLGGLFSSAAVESRLAAESDGEGGGESARTQIGGYRIVRRLSEGGMAQIFLAGRASLGGFEKPVALKVFRRELVEVARGTVQMFLKEAKLCANLNHPNIIQIFDVGEEGGELYLAMEYIEGRDLRAVRRMSHPLPLGILAAVGAQIAAALEYAHHATGLDGQPMQIVHRDVSPQNILLGFDGRIKLIDFGIALAGAELAKRRDVVAGNVAYMSPEQCRGEPLDGRSDIFSLGVVLHEMVSGERLFRRDTLEETMTAVLRAPVPRLEDAPPAIERVILRALERDREKRFQSARQLGRDLAAAAEPLGGASSAAEIGAFLQRLAVPAGGNTPTPTPSPALISPSAPQPTAPAPPPKPTPPPREPVSQATRVEIPGRRKRIDGRWVTLGALVLALAGLVAAIVLWLL
jgi:serine/threonine protein kinase